MQNSVVVKNLSKSFKIYDSPAERLKKVFSFNGKKYGKEFFALKNINFEIKKGEFFGILGRNGAGKSTLLKILSGELTPTGGELDIRGKVSLLQLGVGFDPELSGYENAKFASRILGFKKQDIEGLLKKVEEFADIGEFFHHPVKTYSSGMYSRLSFATAINVDPDILIVDEVLSVGDTRFAQKCLRKMHEFKQKGKTVIIVTHDIHSVSVFCDRAMWIKDGQVFEIGPAKSVGENYRNFMLYDRLPGEPSVTATEDIQDGSIQWEAASKYPQIDGESMARITHLAIYQKQPFVKNRVYKGDETLEIYLKTKFLADIEDPQFGWVLYDSYGLIALHSNNDICRVDIGPQKAGAEVVAKFEITLPNLNRGDFVFSVSIGTPQDIFHRIHDVFPIRIERDLPEMQKQHGYMFIANQGFSLEEKGFNSH